jgi:hypothetical protein
MLTQWLRPTPRIALALSLRVSLFVLLVVMTR